MDKPLSGSLANQPSHLDFDVLDLWRFEMGMPESLKKFWYFHPERATKNIIEAENLWLFFSTTQRSTNMLPHIILDQEVDYEF